MQQPDTAIPVPLDAATVLELHRLARPTASPPGLIEDSLLTGRHDVLEILHAAGEFDRNVAASASYALVFQKRNEQALDWLLSKGLEPGRAQVPGAPAWYGLDVKGEGGAVWQEGFIRMLEAGILTVDHRIAGDFSQPKILLEYALANGADALACEVLQRGVKGDVPYIAMGLKKGCTGAACLMAPHIDFLSRRDLRELRNAISEFNAFGMAPPDEVRDHKTRAMHTVVNALAARALGPADIGEAAFSVNQYVEELQALDGPEQVREVVARHPGTLDDLLRAACRIDAVVVAKVVLEQGARVDASDGGRIAVSPPPKMDPRLFSPHALHNATSAQMMRLLLDYGADLHAKVNDWGVLHWTIENFRGSNKHPDTVAAGKGVFDFLAQQGVDFAEGARGRSVKQLAVTLCDDLKRHLSAIRTGARISSAMDVDASESAPSERGPGVL